MEYHILIELGYDPDHDTLFQWCVKCGSAFIFHGYEQDYNEIFYLGKDYSTKLPKSIKLPLCGFQAEV